MCKLCCTEVCKPLMRSAGQARLLGGFVAELGALTAQHCSVAELLLHAPASCTPACARDVRGQSGPRKGRAPTAPRWRSGGAPRQSAPQRARPPRRWWPEPARPPGRCCSPGWQPSCPPGPLPDGQWPLHRHNQTLKLRYPPSSQQDPDITPCASQGHAGGKSMTTYMILKNTSITAELQRHLLLLS